MELRGYYEFRGDPGRSSEPHPFHKLFRIISFAIGRVLPKKRFASERVQASFPDA